ncbi:response regulator [bacterium]|nr:response regulator [bacterium]
MELKQTVWTLTDQQEWKETPGPADVMVVPGDHPQLQELRAQAHLHLIVLNPNPGLEASENLTLLPQPEALAAVLPLALEKQRLRGRLENQQKASRSLGGILGFARLALNTQLTLTQRQYLEGIFSSALELSARLTRRSGAPSRWSLTGATGLPGPALRVLVADDNPVSQAMAVLALEEQGHEVRLAGDGDSVLQMVREQAFDLVLMDVNMPGLDGYLTTRAIREQERGTLRHLPILAVTAHSREGDAEMCLAAGMDGFVAKPVREEELFQAMQEVLGWSDERVTQQQGILNREGLLRRLGGRQDQLHRVIRQFLNVLPSQLEEVYQHFAHSDHEGLAAALHRLKCSALAFESPRILDSIGRLEVAARRPLGLAESGAVLAELRRELEQLKLELIEVDRGLDRAEARPSEQSGNWPGLDRPLEVLLAEDNPINQTLILGILEEQACRITLAENGQKALEQWQNRAFDVILMDIQMPVMDGLEALTLIRKREAGGRYTPIVVMTATAHEGGAKYLEAGADRYLGKPIQEDELLATLGQIVESRDSLGRSPFLDKAELVDVDALGERLNYKLERLARLSQVFNQVLPGHLAELRQAIEAGHAKGLESGAHRYKTTLRSIEARKSLLHAQQLEVMGREGRLEGSQELLDQLCRESEEIQQKLEQLLAEATVLAQL